MYTTVAAAQQAAEDEEMGMAVDMKASGIGAGEAAVCKDRRVLGV